MGEIVSLVLKVFGIESLGPHVQLDGAVLVLGAQIGPVVPPNVHAVGAQLGLVVGITVVKVVPQEGDLHSGSSFLGGSGLLGGGSFGLSGGLLGGGFRLGKLHAQVFRNGQVAGLAGLSDGHACLDAGAVRSVDGGDGLRKADVIDPDHALVKGPDVEGVGHAGEAGGFQIDDQILPLGGDGGMAAVSQDQVAEAGRIELGVFGMPVHDELGFLAALFTLDADGQILAPGDVLQGPHVDRFAPVGHPIGGMGEIVSFALKAFGIERLGPHVQLDGAVLVLCAQIGPVVPPDVHTVGTQLRLVVRITIVKVVPQEGGRRGGGRLLRHLRFFRNGRRRLLGRFFRFGCFRHRGSSLSRLGRFAANQCKKHAGSQDECE